MKHTAEEYEALAIEMIDEARRAKLPGDVRDCLALAQVYATLAVAAPLEDECDESDGEY